MFRKNYKSVLIILMGLMLFTSACSVSSGEEETTMEATTVETTEAIPKSPVEILKFAGEYRDTNDSSIMYMKAYGDYLDIKIIFPNEDNSYFNLWEMRASLDRQTNVLSYNNATKTTYTMINDKTYNKTVVYEGGSGTIRNEIQNDVNMCIWHGDMSGDKKKDVKYVYAFSNPSPLLNDLLTIIDNNQWFLVDNLYAFNLSKISSGIKSLPIPVPRDMCGLLSPW